MGEWMTNAMTMEEMHSLCADSPEDWSLECSMPLSAGTGTGMGEITIHLCRSDEFIPKKKEHLGAFVSLATTMTKDSGSLSNHYESTVTDFSQSINIRVCSGDNDAGMGNATCSTLSGHSPRAAWPGGVEAYCLQNSDLCSLSHAFNDGYHRGCSEVSKCAPGPFASMAQDHVARVSVNPASMMKQTRSLVFKTPPLSPSSLNLRPRSKSPRARPSSPFKPGPRNDGAQCKTRARKMDCGRGGDKNEANTVAEIKSKKCPAGPAKSRKVPSKVKPRRMNRPEHNHAKSATDVLKHWFASNLASPFPSEVIKNKLADQSGLSIAQVSNWFVNHRKRVLKPLRTAAGLPQLRNRLGKEFPTIPEPPRKLGSPMAPAASH
jgi:hypothetical protein